MKKELETSKLYLRPVKQGDEKPLFSLYSNPNVMRYIYDGSLFSETKTRKRVEHFTRAWQQHEFGFWVFLDKASRAVVGYGGFRYFEDDREQFKDQIELCYMLDEPFWGQGYASELVVTMVQTGLDHGFTSMMATILAENIASQCVVEKAGLSYAFDASFDGLIHRVYVLSVA